MEIGFRDAHEPPDAQPRHFPRELEGFGARDAQALGDLRGGQERHAHPHSTQRAERKPG
jgi:hypothetical protein